MISFQFFFGISLAFLLFGRSILSHFCARAFMSLLLICPNDLGVGRGLAIFEFLYLLLGFGEGLAILNSIQDFQGFYVE